MLVEKGGKLQYGCAQDEDIKPALDLSWQTYVTTMWKSSVQLYTMVAQLSECEAFDHCEQCEQGFMGWKLEHITLECRPDDGWTCTNIS